MPRKRIAFLGNKDIGYECFYYLLENRDVLGIDIAAVITNDKSPLLSKGKSILKLAKKHNIPTLKKSHDLLSITDIDILLSVQYHDILKEQQIKVAKQIAVNLHMAPLPDYRGCNQFSFAILDNAKEFGSTLHRIEKGIDTGDILFEHRFMIEPNSTVTELYEKTYKSAVYLFKSSIKRIVDGDYVLVPQKSLIAFRGSAFHQRKEIDKIKEIDLSWPTEKIKKQVRATYFPPFSPPFALVDGKKIDITPEWILDNLD